MDKMIALDASGERCHAPPARWMKELSGHARLSSENEKSHSRRNRTIIQSSGLGPPAADPR